MLVGPVSGTTMPALMDSAVAVEAAGLPAAGLALAGETAGLLAASPGWALGLAALEVAGWLGAVDGPAPPPQAASKETNNNIAGPLNMSRDNGRVAMAVHPIQRDGPFVHEPGSRRNHRRAWNSRQAQN